MEAIEDNLLRISVIVIALIKFQEYASGFKQTLPSQMLKKVTEKHVRDLCTKKRRKQVNQRDETKGKKKEAF
ncbi:hypothetical protein UP17_13875 [Peribacillus simplex]|uniref:hypothetical protein n=1 Tax=Peribacillus simplex TaxID=1478 RepID=UPI000777A013|nr:hypothetical protein [Peribacillus simplex]AMM93424.1 hypothetical protein UP17_13875 [Peribacillus simplex]